MNERSPISQALIDGRASRSQEEMATAVGVNKSTIVNYEGGHRLPDVEFLATFAKVTGADFSNLIGARLASSDEKNARQLAGDFILKFSTELEADGVTHVSVKDLKVGGAVMAREQGGARRVEINLYNVQASAGPGAVVEDERAVGTRAFDRTWIETRLKMAPEDLALVVVRGDSMVPTLHDGDLIMVNVSENRLRRDGIYLLRDDDDLMVKRLQRLPGGRFRILSDNPQYQPIEHHPLVLQDGTLAVVGRVVWWAHTDV